MERQIIYVVQFGLSSALCLFARRYYECLPNVWDKSNLTAGYLADEPFSNGQISVSVRLFFRSIHWNVLSDSGLAISSFWLVKFAYLSLLVASLPMLFWSNPHLGCLCRVADMYDRWYSSSRASVMTPMPTWPSLHFSKATEFSGFSRFHGRFTLWITHFGNRTPKPGTLTPKLLIVVAVHPSKTQIADSYPCPSPQNDPELLFNGCPPPKKWHRIAVDPSPCSGQSGRYEMRGGAVHSTTWRREIRWMATRNPAPPKGWLKVETPSGWWFGTCFYFSIYWE